MNKTKQPKKVVTEKVKISGTDKKNINDKIKIYSFYGFVFHNSFIAA
jgi:hypothetical protein